jgi:hypothetical protein
MKRDWYKLGWMIVLPLLFVALLARHMMEGTL